MNNNVLTLGVLAVFAFFQFSCNKSTLIGADILPTEDNVNVVFADTFSLRLTTIVQDSVKVYDPSASLQPANYLLGRLDDPHFGIATADIYTEFGLLTTSPDFANAELDSIVLLLEYDAKNCAGNLNAPFSLEIFEVTENIDEDIAYYSDKTFSTGTKLGEKLNFRPAVTDSVLFDTVKAIPHLRIPLSTTFGEYLLDTNNTQYYSDDLNFADFFKGIHIKGSAANEAMLSFNLLGNYSRILVYYTKDDTLHRIQPLVIKSQSGKTMHFTHNYTGSTVAPFIDNPELGDSLAFLQSMQGLNIKVEIPHINQLQNVIINKAELIVTIADTTDFDEFAPADQLIVTELNSEGQYVLIEDVAIAVSASNNLAAIFGGNLTNNSGVRTYRMNLTGHFQDIIDGVLPNNALFITTYPKVSKTNRLIIGGSKHSQYPVKLLLTYTKLD